MMCSMETKITRRSASLRREPQQADDVIGRMTAAYTKMRPKMLRWLTHDFKWEPEDAEDMLQDAWIKLASSPEPDKGSWEPFIIRAVQTVSLDRLEKDSNRRRLHEEKWSNIVRGFDLDTLPEVKLTKTTPTSDNYFQETDNFE